MVKDDPVADESLITKPLANVESVAICKMYDVAPLTALQENAGETTTSAAPFDGATSVVADGVDGVSGEVGSHPKNPLIEIAAPKSSILRNMYF
jgi:hypothetical protein